MVNSDNLDAPMVSMGHRVYKRRRGMPPVQKHALCSCKGGKHEAQATYHQGHRGHHLVFSAVRGKGF